MNQINQYPEIPDDHPIVSALLIGDAEAVSRYLNEGVNPYTQGLIDSAIGTGNTVIVQSFLDHGLDLSLPFNIHGETPIFRTIEKKKMPILKLLLENGASVQLSPTGSSTPLHTAAGIWPEAVPVLLDAGADVNARSRNGRTPLMSAALGNQIPTLELLHAAGARLEDRDERGTTPLLSAARGGKRESIEWLLDHGANIHAKDDEGKTAEYWARENGHPTLAELLHSRLP